MAIRRPRPSAGPATPRERLGWSAAFGVTLVLLPHLATFLFRMSVAQLALPLYASGPAGMEQSTVGLLLGSQAVMALVMLGPAGWATNHFGVRPVVAGALLATALPVALMPLVPTPWGLWVATIMFGGGLAVLGVASGLFIFTLEGYSTGALVGIYRLSGDLMQVFGPVVNLWFGSGGTGLRLGLRGNTQRAHGSSSPLVVSFIHVPDVRRVSTGPFQRAGFAAASAC
jgi:MFS family permease